MADPVEPSGDDPEMMRLRLRIARLLHGWSTARDAACYVEGVGAAKERAYKSYDEGQRTLTLKAIEKLAAAFEVDADWLRHGSGETRAELQRRFSALNEQAKTTPRRMITAGEMEQNPSGKQNLNQLTSNIAQVDINASLLVPTGRIPFLLGEAIALFLAGKRDWAMAGSTLPVPEEFAGPDFFCTEIGASDTSMVGEKGDSFPPRTVLVINTNRAAWEDETPPLYVLARPKGMKGWLLRRLDSALPLSVATEFTLSALNPNIETIRVSDPAKWEIAGRLVADMRRY